MVGVAYAKEIGHYFANLFHDEPDVIKDIVSYTNTSKHKLKLKPIE